MLLCICLDTVRTTLWLFCRPIAGVKVLELLQALRNGASSQLIHPASLLPRMLAYAAATGKKARQVTFTGAYYRLLPQDSDPKVSKRPSSWPRRELATPVHDFVCTG